MTGFIFGSILLLTIVAWAMLVTTHRSPESPGRLLATIFLVAAPFVLFSGVVIAAFRLAPADEYRVALEAVEFRLGAGEAITIGGGTDGEEADDLIVRDLPPRYVTLRAEGDHVVAELPAEMDHDLGDPEYAAVRVDGKRPFANSVALAGQGNVAITTRERLDLNVPERTIASRGATWSTIPTRKQSIGTREVAIGRNLPAETNMYPLRFWARAAPSDDAATGGDGAPLGSFISWDGGFFRGDLYLTLTGDGTSVALDAGRVVRYERKIAEIAPNGHRDFALYRLDYGDPNLDPDNRSRAQERRSFRASYANGRLRIVFDTPDILRLSSTSIAQLVEREKKKDSFLLATRDPKRSAPIVTNQMLLSFPQLGPRVQNELYSAIRVSQSGDCLVRVTSHTGTKCHAPGDAFRIGEDAAAILRITKMSVPWGISLTLLGLAFFSAAWARWQKQDTVALIIISAAEVLLAVRLLIAFEGALLDPSSASALWESLAIFAILPFTLRVVWAFSRTRHRVLLPSHATLGAIAATALAEAAAIIALVAIALTHARVEGWIIWAVCVVAVVLLPLGVGWIAPRVIDALTARARSVGAIALFAIAILAVRAIIWLVLGWKERISFGGADLAITVIYLPFVFLFFAWVWDRYRDTISTPATVLFVAFAAALTIGMPIAVKDSGSVLVHVPAIALLFALPALVRPNAKKLVLAAPFVLIVVAHALVFATPRLRGKEDIDPARNTAYQSALASEAEANRYLEERLQKSTNDLRLMSSIAPHQLEEAGTSKAEGLVMQRRMLDRYGGRGLFGAGYLDVPLAFFRDTHLNDNLSAIHVLAPFGAAGALGVVALLAALALLPMYIIFDALPAKTRQTPEAAIDQRMALGTMALWTFCICGIYMFAANLGLVLFTGKNVYLLAASSKSDAIEGGVLLLIALLTLFPTKAPEGARLARPVHGERQLEPGEPQELELHHPAQPITRKEWP
ncbi:MAG: hypothetical protein M3P06_03010 [Acidobacteriota bacterium]|nr:hypothetical protein [Acidobacteriota bacterium]